MLFPINTVDSLELVRFSQTSDYTPERFQRFARQLLLEATTLNRELGEKGYERIKSEKDLVLVADMAISEHVRNLARASGIEATLFTEELGENKLVDDPRIVIGFDDLDGTFNKSDGRGILPYCSIISIFDAPKPTHNDAVYAGIQMHHTGDLIEAVRGQGVFMNGKSIKPAKIALDEETRLYVSIYETSRVDVKTGSRTLAKLVPLMARTRCPGEILSAGVSFAMIPVHGGAYLSAAVKEHELGAGYLLARECGGVAIDFDGKDIGPRLFDFNAKVPVIAASSEAIAQEILAELRK